MKELKKTVILDHIFYITRDIERALGLDLNTPNYYIISNYTEYGKSLAKKHKNVFLIREKRLLDTWELMDRPDVKRYIQEMYESTKITKVRKLRKLNILVFKNTSQIEKICKKNNWNLRNPPSKLVNKIEQKISQVQWAEELKKYFPNYKIKKCQDIEWRGEKIIIQFNQSHTGSGTILIQNKKQLDELKNKFPKRLARTAKYIVGPLFTNNNVVWKNNILMGNINYQITGLKPFTDVKFATIGNDWALPHKLLTKKQINQYYKIAEAVGKKMMKNGWKGLFGIDVVMESKTKRLYLLEINARQPASVAYESYLQSCSIKHETGGKRITTFEAHLASLLKLKYNDEKLIEIKDGAQIIYRVNSKIVNSKIVNSKNKIEKLGLKTILYNNNKLNADLLRIQSKKGIMKGYGRFNTIGLNIKNILK